MHQVLVISLERLHAVVTTTTATTATTAMMATTTPDLKSETCIRQEKPRKQAELLSAVILLGPELYSIAL